MKYLCLVYAEEKKLAATPGREWDALIAENLALCEDLRRTGHFVSAAPLAPVATAATVRVRGGRRSTVDGPFAETKEQLGGYYLIEARDLAEAVQVAGRIPGARLGSVEVRQILAHDPREPWPRPRELTGRSPRPRPAPAGRPARPRAARQARARGRAR